MAQPATNPPEPGALSPLACGSDIANPSATAASARRRAAFTTLRGERYISLETFRRNGTGVCTPVWFAVAPGRDDLIFIYTDAQAGKVKRIHCSAVVRIAPCDMRGRITGAWIDAHAAIVDGSESNRGMALLNRKYWPWKQMLDLFARLTPGHQRVMITVTPA